MECDFCGAKIRSRDALACPECGNPLTGKPDEPGPGAARPSLDELVDLAGTQTESAAAGTPVEVSTSPESPTEPAPPETFDALILADQSVPPGTTVPAEEVPITEDPTGGYKGPGGPSVAGAGVQTADDPFGLDIDESAPPLTGDEKIGRSGAVSSPWKVVIVALAVLMLAAAVAASAYFGFFRKGNPESSLSPPEMTVRGFCKRAAEGGSSLSLERYAVPGSPIIVRAQQVLEPYDNTGLVVLKTLDTELIDSDGQNATVGIRRFEVEVIGDEKTQVFDVLEQTLPASFPTTIKLVRQDGKWLISG